ncbi:MAG: hypothetical protein ABI114_16495 [Rhodanobacter sp.]
MDLISILATVILTTTIATVLTGFVAYSAFKLREKRRPTKRAKHNHESDGDQPIFFSCYVPESTERHDATDVHTP